MKNILIITIGSREVQIPANLPLHLPLQFVAEEIETAKGKEIRKKMLWEDKQIPLFVSPVFPDFYTLTPRTAGKIIAEAFEVFAPYLVLPMVQPVVDYIKANNIVINRIILVFTDQEKELKEKKIKPFHYNNDTLYFAEIAEMILQKDAYFAHTDFDSYGVFEQVNSYHAQYELFAKAKDTLVDDPEIEKVYLLPQGGIDSINQSLTLRLIEIYKDKFVQLQKSEDVEVIASEFPAKFLNTLNRQKLQKHLEDYAFQLIDISLISDKQVLNLCQYATKRLSLKHDRLREHVSFLKKKGIIFPLPTDEKTKIIDMYCSAKISGIQKNWGDFLGRMFSFSENFMKLFLHPYLPNIGGYWKHNNGENREWVQALNRLQPDLAEKLRNSKIKIDNPNRKAYLKIYKIRERESTNKQDIIKICIALESLANLRNGFIHSLRAVEEDDIENALSNYQFSRETLCAKIDDVLELVGLGIFDEIKTQIEALIRA